MRAEEEQEEADVGQQQAVDDPRDVSAGQPEGNALQQHENQEDGQQRQQHFFGYDGILSRNGPNTVCETVKGVRIGASAMRVPCKVPRKGPSPEPTRIGPIETTPIRPKPRSLEARVLLRSSVTPSAIDMMNGTVMAPVVAPDASKAMARNSSEADSANRNTPA